jgi:hypothetical protein
MTAVTNATTEVPTSEAEKTPSERFKWRAWVHYPAEAESCDHAQDGKCADEEHFHALIRLPNAYQQADIVEKGQAARARKLRALRDPESDAAIILEDQLDVLRGADKAILVDELLDRNFTDDYLTAVREVESRDDPTFVPEGEEDIPKQWEHIDQDREEYMRQRELPEDQRSDDFELIERHYGEYSDTVTQQLAAQAPRREHLESLDMEQLIDMVRRERIESLGNEAYLKAYAAWQMFVSTFRGTTGKTQPTQRYWSEMAYMRNVEDHDVITAVDEGFKALEQQMARTRSGKGS